MIQSGTSYVVVAIGLLRNSTLQLQQCNVTVDASYLLNTNNDASDVAVAVVASSVNLSGTSHFVSSVGQLRNVTMTLQKCDVILGDGSRLMATNGAALGVAITAVASSLTLRRSSAGIVVGELTYPTIHLQGCNVTLDASCLLYTSSDASGVGVAMIGSSMHLGAISFAVYAIGYISNATMTLLQCNMIVVDASRLVSANIDASGVAVIAVAASLTLSGAARSVFASGHLSGATMSLQQCNVTMNTSYLLYTNSNASGIAVTVLGSSIILTRTSYVVLALGHITHATLTLHQCNNITVDASRLLTTNNNASHIAMSIVGSSVKKLD